MSQPSEQLAAEILRVLQQPQGIRLPPYPLVMSQAVYDISWLAAAEHDQDFDQIAAAAGIEIVIAGG